MMVRIQEFDDQTEAQMAADLLRSHGLEVEVVGTRSYTSILMGGVHGRYFLKTNDKDRLQAQEILVNTEQSYEERQTTKDHQFNPEYYFRRSFVFAALAFCLLPVIANIISMRDAFIYVRANSKKSNLPLYIFAISALQIPGMYIAWILLKSIFQGQQPFFLSF